MSAFNECAFNECAFESINYTGIWKTSFSFTYEAGATVYVTPTISATVPGGTSYKIYFSETDSDYTECFSGVQSYIVFENSVSGSTTMYCKIEMYSGQTDLTPVINSLTIDIHQETSLYTIGTQVLEDALTTLNGSWYIDTELQKYKIAYGWLNQMSHRKALARIAEAAGGVCFQARNGDIRLEAGTFFNLKASDPADVVIGENRILNIESEINPVFNKIQVKTMPYVETTEVSVWTLSGDNSITSGEYKTYTASFNYDAVVDCRAEITSTPTGATIYSEDYFFGGATIVVLGSATQDITLEIFGKPLELVGTRVITETNGDSIRRYGEKTIVIKDNNLIQSVEIAELISESIVNITAAADRDVTVKWRGDPTIELGDIFEVESNKYAVVSLENTFNGYLESTMKGRKL